MATKMTSFGYVIHVSRCSPKDWQDKINKAAIAQKLPALAVTETGSNTSNEDKENGGDSVKKIFFADSSDR